MKTQEYMATYKARRGQEQILPSEETNPANTLILDIQPLELYTKFLLFKPPGVWSFVTAAQVSEYTI